LLDETGQSEIRWNVQQFGSLGTAEDGDMKTWLY